MEIREGLWPSIPVRRDQWGGGMLVAERGYVDRINETFPEPHAQSAQHFPHSRRFSPTLADLEWPSLLQFQWSYRWDDMLAHQNIRRRTQIFKILYGGKNGWWWEWWWCTAQISETVTDAIYIVTAESYNDAYCAHCNLTSKKNKWRSRLWKR